ncbi:MAG TPA: LamG-like jellyroll fold domain-containing protein [Chryseosolibacter sp.]
MVTFNKTGNDTHQLARYKKMSTFIRSVAACTVIALAALTDLHGQGFEQVVTLTPFPTSKNSGERTQSKVWQYDGKWWSVFPNSEGTFIWRLDGTTWTNVLNISSSSNTKADCKPVGNVCHILLVREYPFASQLVSVEYNPSTGNYGLWSQRPSTTQITLDDGLETATIDIDNTGRMWLASDGVDDIRARWSDFPYSAWSDPIVIQPNVSIDDIGTVVALPVQGQVGIFWGNQNTRRFGFKTHNAGANPSEWSADEIPAGQSALDIKLGMADDHISLGELSDGTLFAACKTGYDTNGYPKIILLRRHPNGTWDDAYSVSETGTKPLIVINEPANKLKVIFPDVSGGNILYAETSLSNISFGPAYTLLSGSYDGPTSAKTNYTSDIVVLVSDNLNKRIAGVRGIDTQLATPSVPILKSPANFATNQPLTISFSWQPSTGAGTYALQVSEFQDFSALFYQRSGITGTSAQVTGFLPAKSYYWRVRASNAAGNSNWSTIWKFSTLPPIPDVPQLVSPPNLAVAENSTLIWKSAPYATSYHLQLSTLADFSTTFADESALTDTTYNVSGLTSGETYYWRVSARNVTGSSDWSSPWSFTAAASSLAAYWKMDEGGGKILSDDSGNGNNATITGLPKWMTGISGYALVLNGSNQYASAPDAQTLDITKGITLAAWVRPERKENQKIIMKGDQNSADGYELSLLRNGRVSFAINQHTSTLRVNSNTTYADKKWIHIAGTFNGTELKIFINGAQSNSITVASPVVIGANGLALYLGRNTNGTNYFKGALDEVRVYNYALSAAEVYALTQVQKMNSTARTGQSAAVAVSESESNPVESSVHVYPNPAGSTLYVDLPPGGAHAVSIYDITGRLLYADNKTTGENHLAIPLDTFALRTGFYILSVRSAEADIRKKFFKK